MKKPIPLSQKLYLLGIHPERGGLISSAYSRMNTAVLGALLLELNLNGNISFEKGKVIFLSDKATNPSHRYIIEKIKKRTKPVSVSRWINRLAYSNRYFREQVQLGLTEKRLINMEAKHFLFFRWKKSKILDHPAVFQLFSEVQNQVFKGTEVEEEIMLLTMLKPAGLLKRVFPDAEKRRQALQKLEKMKSDNQVSKAVAAAIETAQAVAASVIVTTASNH